MSVGPVNEAARMRAYLDGWDDGLACAYRALADVPDEQLAEVVRALVEAHTPGPVQR